MSQTDIEDLLDCLPDYEAGQIEDIDALALEYGLPTYSELLAQYGKGE